jgi:CheY-like chemotaxis protein
MDRKTILCIAHTPETIELVQRVLNHEGEDFSLQVAHKGQEGLELARKEKPGLILLSTRLLDVDGWEMLEQIRMDREISCIPVIMLRTSTSLALKRLPRFLPDASISSPFSPQELMDAIHRVLDTRGTTSEA